MYKQTHIENTGSARFVTFSCYHNYNLFKSDTIKHIFINHLIGVREKYDLMLYGYVIMPNHVHLVLLPSDEVSLSKVIGELKSLSAREIIAYWKLIHLDIFKKLSVVRDRKEKFVFWQRKYYDDNCRTKEKVIEKINYCHNNLVVSGLVNSPDEWEWSSYRWFYGFDKVLLEMDKVE